MPDISVHIESLNEEIATRAAEGRDCADLIKQRNELRREQLSDALRALSHEGGARAE
jgi:hypothetical protein